MNELLTAFIGFTGVIAGVSLGGLAGILVDRAHSSREARRAAYVEWLRRAHRIPVTFMELARTSDIDVQPSEQLKGELAEMRALLDLDGSGAVRELIEAKWQAAADDYHAMFEGLSKPGESALQIMEEAHREALLPFLREMARLMAKELHGRRYGK